MAERLDARGSAGWTLFWVLATLIPVGFLAVFFAWPAAALIARGFIAEGRPTLDGFTAVFAEPRTWRILRQTLSQALWGTALSVLLGVPGAYVLYKTRFPGRAVVRAVATIPFVLPTVVVGVAFKTLFAATGPLGFLGLDETFAVIVAALVFFNFSVIVRTVGGLWARLDPRLGEAARVLGASPLRVLATVTLPALAPAIASGAAIVFLFCAGAYGTVMILGGVRFGTIETEIWYRTTQLLDLSAAAALAVVQLVFVSVALWVSNRLQARASAQRLCSDESSERAWMWRRDWAPTLVTGVVVLGLLVLPMANLVARSLWTPDGPGLRYYALLFTVEGTGLHAPVWEAVVTSLTLAAQASALAVTLGVLVSLVLSRRPRRRPLPALLRTLDSVFMLPLGVSAVTVGFGFLITLNRPPLDLRSSPILIPIAQAMVALPLVVRSLLPVLRAIDPRQREAAATLGAGPGRVLATIDLPYALRGLGLAVGFALATSLGEFGATSFLARPDAPTLPVVIYRLIGRPGVDNYGMAMAAAVILAVVTGAVMAAAERLRPKEATGW
ncbi:MAG: iron ABC transporter permease [Propionibacterium sp.]|nr:iron ABC transporter permease [Propionibacterium sp.]